MLHIQKVTFTFLYVNMLLFNQCKLKFPDSCGTEVRNLSIAISAACFSLLYCAYSACLTGAICIFPKIDMISGRSSRVRNILLNNNVF